jgi:hypothetical protein
MSIVRRSERIEKVPARSGWIVAKPEVSEVDMVSSSREPGSSSASRFTPNRRLTHRQLDSEPGLCNFTIHASQQDVSEPILQLSLLQSWPAVL